MDKNNKNNNCACAIDPRNWFQGPFAKVAAEPLRAMLEPRLLFTSGSD
jgi:hypothetical protein